MTRYEEKFFAAGMLYGATLVACGAADALASFGGSLRSLEHAVGKLEHGVARLEERPHRRRIVRRLERAGFRNGTQFYRVANW